jgi:hypothetical protein
VGAAHPGFFVRARAEAGYVAQAARESGKSAARGAKHFPRLTSFQAERYRLDTEQIGRISDSPNMRAIAEEDRNARLLDVALQGS